MSPVNWCMFWIPKHPVDMQVSSDPGMTTRSKVYWCIFLDKAWLLNISCFRPWILAWLPRVRLITVLHILTWLLSTIPKCYLLASSNPGMVVRPEVYCCIFEIQWSGYWTPGIVGSGHCRLYGGWFLYFHIKFGSSDPSRHHWILAWTSIQRLIVVFSNLMIRVLNPWCHWIRPSNIR